MTNSPEAQGATPIDQNQALQAVLSQLERQGQSSKSTQEVAEDELNKEISRTGNNPVEKRNLLVRLFKRLFSKTDQAESVRKAKNVMNKNPFATPDRNTQETAKEASMPVYQVLKAVRDGMMTHYIDQATNTTSQTVIEPKTKTILEDIAHAQHTDFTASILQPVLTKLISKPDYVTFSSAGGTKTEFELDIEKVSVDEKTATVLKNAILRAISRRQIVDVASQEELDLKFVPPEKENLEKERKRGKEQQEENRIEKIKDKIQQDIDLSKSEEGQEGSLHELAKRAQEFVDKMESVDKFHDFYAKIYSQEMAKINKYKIDYPRKQNESEGDYDARINRLIGEKISAEMNRTVLYIVNTIFKEVLASTDDPKEQFNQAAKGADQFFNPVIIFETFQNRLTELKSNSVEYERRNRAKIQEDYYIPSFKGQSASSSDLGFKNVAFSDFVENLENYTATERRMLEFSHNTLFLILGGRLENKSLIQALGEFANSIDTTDLDRIRFGYQGEEVVTVQSLSASLLERKLARVNFERSETIVNDLFGTKGGLNRDLSKFLDDNSAGMMQWEKNRASLLGRMLFAGPELGVHAKISRAMAPKGGQGSEFEQNALFDRAALAFRWGLGTGDDKSKFAGKGALWMDIDDIPEGYSHEEYRKQAFKVVEDMDQYGRLAIKANKLMKGRFPTIDKNRYLPIGGISELASWRVWGPMTPLFDQNDIVGTKPENMKLNISRENVLVRAIHAVENDGVNNIRELTLNRFFSDDFLKIENGQLVNEKRYEELMKYAYNRYFKQGSGSGVGEVYVKGIGNADVYWSKIKKEIDTITSSDKKDKADHLRGLLQNEMFKVMSVMAFEHSPTTFMDRIPPRYEQNGVTLYKQMKDRFTDSKQGGTWTEQEFYQIEDELLNAQAAFKKKMMHEIDEKRTQWGNIYGEDLNAEMTSLNEGKGYILGEEEIKAMLTKKYSEKNPPVPEVEVNKIIQRTVALHRELKRSIMDKPITTEFEEKLFDTEGGYDPEKITRLEWFRKVWQEDGIFNGDPLNLDEGKYKRYELSDQKALMQRVMGTVQKIEEVRAFRDNVDDEGMYKTLKAMIRGKGPETWEDFRSMFASMQTSLLNEWDGPVVKKVIEDEIKMLITMATKDMEKRGLMGVIRGIGDKGRDSIAAEFAYWSNNSFDSSDVKAFTRYLASKNLLSPEQAEKVQEKMKGTWGDIIKENWAKWLIMLFILLLVSGLKEGYDEVEED